MPTSEQAILYYEAAQNAVDLSELTDQGDQMEFRSSSELWSGKSGKQPTIRPNGLITGGVITPESGATNDEIDISAATAYLSGVLRSPSAASGTSVTRQSVSDYKKFSVTITNAGAFAVVDGTEGSSFSDTRGAAGGPPYIDNDAIEIGQIWLSSQVAAPITADEIKQVVGQSQERYDYPLYEIEYANVEGGALGNAGILFHSALQYIHSEDAGSNTYARDVYASWYEPVFVELVDAYDFVPPANSHTVNTTQVYGRTKGSKSTTLNQGSFSVELTDGISDNLLSFKDDFLWFKFKQDRLRTPYILAQGYLGVQENFPAGANVMAQCTISPEVLGERVTQ